jgi:hypothetical protein
LTAAVEADLGMTERRSALELKRIHQVESGKFTKPEL